MNFCARLCVEYYDEITEAGFDFVIDIPDREIPVSADVDLLSRVISNLLSNALRYNKSGKVIAVSMSGESGKAVLSVSDDGEEVDRAFAGQMFHAFSRGIFQENRRRHRAGTGDLQDHYGKARREHRILPQRREKRVCGNAAGREILII